MANQVTIHATIRGAFWWPIGEEYTTDVSHDVAAYERCCSEPCTLREHILEMLNDGNSSQGCTIDEGYLKITRTSENRRVIRFFDLGMFPSIDDVMTTG